MVGYGDAAEVRQAVADLSTDAALYNRLAQSAYNGFVSSFSWEVMGERLLRAYAGVLGPTPRAQRWPGVVERRTTSSTESSTR